MLIITKVRRLFMKKLITLACVLSLSASILLSSCASTQKEKNQKLLDPVVIEGVETKCGNLILTNLPHFELIALLCRVAELPNFNGYYTDDNSYLEQMAALLGRYKDHAVISTIKSFSSRGVSPDAFVSLAYHLRPDFSGPVVSLSPRPVTLHRDWDNVSSSELNSFIKLLHDFAIESNFARIYGLNQSTCISDCLRIQRDLEKYKFDEWMSEFYNAAGEEQTVNINISRANVACNYYDHAIDENQNKTYHLSIFVGSNLNHFANLYSLCFLQDYVSENWDTVKEPFINFVKSAARKIYANDKEALKNIDTKEYNDWLLSSYLSEIIVAFYLDEALAEADGIYGVIDENVNSAIKIYGEEVAYGVFDLIQEYIDNRDIYPDFKSYYPKLNEFVLSLPSDN